MAGEQLVYPIASGTPLPNNDLPDDAAVGYLEARSIIQISPRGAAALLRLAIQKLCVHLERPGKNFNADLKQLVRNGPSVEVQQTLDNVRVTGNDGVDPGQIDFHDKPGTQPCFSTW